MKRAVWDTVDCGNCPKEPGFSIDEIHDGSCPARVALHAADKATRYPTALGTESNSGVEPQHFQ